ncbi:MAG: hypothetical protein COB20_08710 [SAR86 cluster bacterium]|uniref:ABC transporter permease n=1 Tax=SAR86 cluster bacterium TaxID=2030880 RepID=A0A2A4X3E7_9GAMM|nr:MAG: hypothetical protein COB20_08710 [SAR86 cluster bacterium]
MSKYLFYNYLITTIRTLHKQPVFSAIKILSLTLGLVCALLVLAHVQYIYSFDKRFPNWQSIYRVVSSNIDRDYIGVSDPFVKTLPQEYAQIQHIARVRPASAPFSRVTDNSNEASINSFVWVDPAIISLFSLEFVRGDSSTALAEINSIVLSETFARKYFGEEDALGQILAFDDRADLTVTGVMRDLPANTSLRIEAMISADTGYQINPAEFMNFTSFGASTTTQTFFSVSNQAEADIIANDLDNFLDRHINDASFSGQRNLRVLLEPLSDVYLSPRNELSTDEYNLRGGTVGANIFYGLIIFALLILLTSCVNYANLSMSQLQQRGREIGVRKAVGANQEQIVVQFLLETLTITLIALILAAPLIQAAVPVYTNLTNTAFTVDDMLQSDRLPWMLLFVLATGLLSGLLPALTTARIQPSNIVKGATLRGKLSRSIRASITVFQFSLSGTLVILAVGTVFLIDHLNELEIGFNRYNLVVLDHGFTLAQRRDNYQGWDETNSALNNELAQHPGILNVAESTVAPPNTGWSNPWRRLHWPENRTPLTNTIGVDENFIETMQLQLIAGRALTQDFPADFMEGEYGDTERIYGAVVSRSALDDFELGTPEEALDEILYWSGFYTYRIVGVVEDFRFAGGLEDSDRSASILWATNQPGFFTILRIDPSQREAALAHIDSVWEQHRPGTPVSRRFFEQTYDQLIYERTNGINKASLFAAFITICIAAMGLYALAVYATQRRIKEVGVRKTLGATSLSIVGLLSWDFIKPVAMACVVSWITGYLAVSYFYAQFYSYPEIPIGVYIAIAAGTVLLATFTVAVQCFLAANTNPVQSLRCE